MNGRVAYDLSAKVIRKHLSAAEHGPGLLQAVAGLSLSMVCLDRDCPLPDKREREKRRGDITPDTPLWSIGRGFRPLLAKQPARDKHA